MLGFVEKIILQSFGTPFAKEGRSADLRGRNKYSKHKNYEHRNR
jgi:hypothetical protein